MDVEQSAGAFGAEDKDKATAKDHSPLEERSINQGENDLLGGEVDAILAAKMMIVNDVSAQKNHHWTDIKPRHFCPSRPSMKSVSPAITGSCSV